MKKISITIPSELSAKEEIKLISERLTQKALSGNGKQLDKIRIGTQVDIQHLQTQITITRKPKDVIELIKCIVCRCEFQNDLFKPVFTNYGGVKKLNKTCSESCQDLLIEICGDGRSAKSKNKLSHFIKFN